METFIALLRGINVGGKNKVPMPELKALFEQNGFSGVSTYINSGNVIFHSEEHDAERLKAVCEGFLSARYPFPIPVMVLSAKDLREAIANAPSFWGADQDAKHNAIFVIPPKSVASVFAEVGETKPECEKAGYYGRVIFWSAPIATFSTTRWAKVVQSSAYQSITIRNENTARRLAQLAD